MKILKNYNVLFLAIAMLLIAILTLMNAIEIKDLKIANEDLRKEIKNLKIEDHYINIALEGLYE